jgi:hypothetical protein
VTALIHDGAVLVVVAGLIAAALALVRTHRILWPITILLDFLTAAGLLRLVGPQNWSHVVTVVLTIAIRQVASLGLRLTQVRSN